MDEDLSASDTLGRIATALFGYAASSIIASGLAAAATPIIAGIIAAAVAIVLTIVLADFAAIYFSAIIRDWILRQDQEIA